MRKSNDFSLPKDFRSRVEFRALEDEVGYATACGLILTLWGDLAYLAETQRLGFISDAQIKRMLVDKFSGLTDLIGRLCRTQNIVQETDGYLCGPFIAHNAHLSAEKADDSERFGFIGTLNSVRRNVERESEEQSIFFDRTKINRPDGTPMSDAEFKQCLMLIRLVDHHYTRPERLPKDYSIGMLLDAYAVNQHYSEAVINGVCFYIHRARLRKDLAIPERTEELLRNFDACASKFGRSGVMMHAKRRQYAKSQIKA